MKTKIFTVIFIFCLGITNLSAQNFWNQTSTVGSPSAHVPAIKACVNGTILASCWTNGVWRSTNNGVNWSATTISAARIFFVGEGLNGTKFAISTSNTGPTIHRSTNDGLTWTAVFQNPRINNYFYGGGITAVSADTLVAAISFTLGPTIGDVGIDIVRSTNGGANWILLGTRNWGGANAIHKLSDGRIFVTTTLSGIQQSTNNGATWSPVSSFPPIYTSYIATNSKGHIFVGRSTAAGYAPLLFRSTDGGTTWHQFMDETVGSATGGDVMALDIDSKDRILMSIVKSGPTERKFYSSTNNGETWTEIMSGFPAAQTIYSLTANSQNIVFAGTTSSGVFKGGDNISSIGNISENPGAFTLQQNYPNPFNPETTIKYSLTTAGKVTLSVFDAAGKTVKTLVNTFQPQGDYNLIFNGSELTSGVYFYKIEITSGGKDFSEIRKMMLIK